MRGREESIFLKCNYINDTAGITMPKEIVKYDSETLPQFSEFDIRNYPASLQAKGSWASWPIEAGLEVKWNILDSIEHELKDFQEKLIPSSALAINNKNGLSNEYIQFTSSSSDAIIKYCSRVLLGESFRRTIWKEKSLRESITVSSYKKTCSLILKINIFSFKFFLFISFKMKTA